MSNLIHNVNEMDDIHADTTIEPEDAEAQRLKTFLDEVFLVPVEMEPDFYKAAFKYISGEEAYYPQINDYQELQDYLDDQALNKAVETCKETVTLEDLGLKATGDTIIGGIDDTSVD